MAKPQTPESPDQDTLFTAQVQTEQYDDIVHRQVEYEYGDAQEATPPAEEIQMVAPSTDVKERASHLVLALNHLAQANKRAGLRAAIEVPSAGRELQARYGAGLADVVKGAQFNEAGNQNSDRNQAQAEFKKALQSDGSEIRDEDEANKDYVEFYRKFAGTSNRNALVKMRKNLKKQFNAKPGEGPTKDPDVFTVPATPRRQPFELKDRNSLTRVFSYEYMGLNPENYADITPAEMQAVKASSLQPFLFGMPSKREGAIAYLPPERSEPITYVALTPAEDILLTGSIETLGNRAISKSQQKRQPLQGENPSQEVVERDAAAAQRAGVHAVEGKIHSMERYVAMTEKNLGLLAKFSKNAKDRNLSMFGDEKSMRENVAYLRTYVIDPVIEAVGKQKGWNVQETKRYQNALVKSIFIAEDNQQQDEDFKAILALAADWNSYKWAVAKTKLDEARRYVRKHQPQEVA